jgi:hypothetical protein
VRQNPSVYADVIRGPVGDLRNAVDYLEKQPYCRGKSLTRA